MILQCLRIVHKIARIYYQLRHGFKALVEFCKMAYAFNRWIFAQIVAFFPIMHPIEMNRNFSMGVKYVCE